MPWGFHQIDDEPTILDLSNIYKTIQSEDR